jgi:hypothetical protein
MDLRKRWDSLSENKKKVIKVGVGAATMLPVGRMAKAAVVAGRAVSKTKAAEKAYKSSRPLYDHVSRKFRREEEELFKKK